MTSRREFLQAAVVLSATPIPIRAGVPLDPPLALSSVVIDERHAAARAFGSSAERAGVSPRNIQGDVTELWLDLRSKWSRAPTPLAGLTLRPALFCLEQLAWEHRMRVVHHAEHRVHVNGRVTHAALVSAPGLSAAELTVAGDAWPVYAAKAMARLRTVRTACGPSAACLEGTVGDDAITLHSWVIA